MARRESGRICVGVIKGTRGLKGELRIKSYTDNPEDVAAYGPVETEDGTQHLTLLHVKISGGGVLARAAEVTSRDAAEALTGTRLYIARDALPPVEVEDEYYYTDLIGLIVEGQDGKRIGQVVAVQNFGGSDLLEVKVEGVRETAYVPFTAEIVPVVDMTGGKVVIDPPEGLLEPGSARKSSTGSAKTKRR